MKKRCSVINGQKRTTAVDDIDKKEPTKIPSDNFAPQSCKISKRDAKFISTGINIKERNK